MSKGSVMQSETVLSLIIPLYNEEAGIAVLLSRCVATLEGITKDFEIVCVDDGSTDGTLSILRNLRAADARIKIAVLSRNFGHQAAYSAGLSLAKGECVATMDGDLQDPPELLRDMYSVMQLRNCDVVNGRRIGRADPLLKRIVGATFHRVFRQFSRLPGVGDVGNYALFNRRVLNALLQLQEKNRYLPGLRFFVGFTQESVDYQRLSRGAGESKMSIAGLLRLGFDAIFSFSSIPLKVCLFLGASGVVLSLGGLFYTVISKLLGIAPFGWSSIILSIFFFGSIQLLFLGVIGEYIFRIYREIQNRPLFLIREYFD